MFDDWTHTPFCHQGLTFATAWLAGRYGRLRSWGHRPEFSGPEFINSASSASCCVTAVYLLHCRSLSVTALSCLWHRLIRFILNPGAACCCAAANNGAPQLKLETVRNSIVSCL